MNQLERQDEAIASITDALVEKGFQEYQAAPLADAIYHKLAQTFNGLRIRFSVDAKILQQRDDNVRQHWHNGLHRDKICKAFDISQRTFYRIINKPESDECSE